MQSSNPIFTRAEGFNGRSATGNTTYPGSGPQDTAYGDPSQWGTGTPGTPGTTQVDQGRMTIDSVVQKTGASLFVVVLVAAATWVLTGDIDTEAQLRGLFAIGTVAALVGFGLSFFQLKRSIGPGLVLTYAAVEGVFVGAFSKGLETVFAEPGTATGGLVLGAVAGTLAAVVGTLAVYKFFNIKVGARFYKFMFAAVIGFVALTLLDFALSFFGASFGFNGFGTMGLISSVLGLGLGVLMLILDFDFVERGIAAGLPDQESWRAAFGLTVTIVWIYVEMLRILAILRGD